MGTFYLRAVRASMGRVALGLWALMLAGLQPGCGSDPSPPLLLTSLTGHTLRFERGPLRRPQRKRFLLFNQGQRPLQIEAITLQGRTDVFAFSGPSLPLKLKPGESHGVELEITYTPKQKSLYEAELWVYSDADNADDMGRVRILLKAASLEAPALVWECGPTLSFGFAQPGQDKRLPCRVRNKGSVDVLLKQVSYSSSKGGKFAFGWVRPGLPLTLKAGESTTGSLVYHPNGDHPEAQGELRLVTTPAGAHPPLRVEGLLAEGQLKVSPQHPCERDADCRSLGGDIGCSQKLCLPTSGAPLRRVHLPPAAKGSTTQAVVLLQNLGYHPLQIRRVYLKNGTPRDLALKIAGLQFPVVLDHRQQMPLVLTYTPTSTQRVESVLTIETDLRLQGRVDLQVQASLQSCALQISTTSPGWCPQGRYDVRLENRGTGACEILEIAAVEAQKFSISPKPRLPLQLKPNQSHTFSLAYTAKSPSKGVLRIVSDDPKRPTQELILLASPCPIQGCGLTTQPQGVVDFGALAEGHSKELELQFKNLGTGACQLHKLEIKAPEFELLRSPLLPLKLQPLATAQVTLRFTPPRVRASYAGQLTVEFSDHQDKHRSASIQLQGSAYLQCLFPTPSQLDFGLTKTGCSSPTQQIRLFHKNDALCPTRLLVLGFKLPSKSFHWQQVPPTDKQGHPMARGSFVDLKLQFRPQSAAAVKGALTIDIADVPGQAQLALPLKAEGVASDAQRDLFSVPRRSKLDILFVVDDSGSMAHTKAQLIQEARQMHSGLSKLQLDAHIMVTGSDTQSFSVPAGCARGVTKVITSSTPKAADVLEANLKLGSSRSAIDRGLEAAYRALQPHARHGCNKGFYRKDAGLLLLFASRQRDFSPQSVGFYKGFFQNLKHPTPQKLQAVAIVGPPDKGCKSPSLGQVLGAPRYWQLSQELGGIQQSICDSDWKDVLSRSLGHFAVHRQFTLSRPAEPGSIVVKVNGKQVISSAETGWSYLAKTRQLLFASPATPPPGATVEVAYKASCAAN